ncbi:hypothetical protein KI387_011951, partial [Taxus chinensis]
VTFAGALWDFQVLAALGAQHMEEKSECETQEEASSLSLTQALTVPVPILVSRFRNKREVELVMEASKFAVNFDDVLEKYEMISVRAQALKEAWDNLWVSQEPLLVAAIPLIGEKMSGINRMRAHLMKKMDAIIERLQELRMDGIDRLATDKLFLSELEQELAKRINIVCTEGSIQKLSGKMADFINSLTTRLELSKQTMCDPTAQNADCDSLNKTVKPDQDTGPITNISMQCQEQMMGKDSASTSASKAPDSQEKSSGQTGKALDTSVVGTCFASGGLAHNDMDMIAQCHSSVASEEQLPDLG